jgi:hypothetical protein
VTGLKRRNNKERIKIKMSVRTPIASSYDTPSSASIHITVCVGKSKLSKAQESALLRVAFAAEQEMRKWIRNA